MAISKQQKQRAYSNTAVIYARFSSTNQREESIDAQVRACRKFAEEKGLIITRIYADSARSGTNDNRPEFQQMLQDSKTGFFDTVIVHKLDRFSRNRYDSIICKKKLKMNNCRLMSVTERLDDSPESIMMEAVTEGMNEYYSQNLAREVLKGQKETALQCKHVGGTPPLGYDVDRETHRYIINEKEAETVRLIFRMYAEGNGYKQIQQYLNSNGYRTKANNQFANGSLNNLLKNEKYKGIFIFNLRKEKDFDGIRRPKEKDSSEVIRIEGGMPRIIEDVTFAKVQSLMQRNLKRGGSFKAKELYLLSGLVYCGNCGMSMFGNSRYCGRNKLKYVTYKCSGRAQKRTCNTKELNKNYIENFVLDALYNNLFSKHSIEKLTDMLNQYKNEIQQKTQKELTEATGKLKAVVKETSQTLEIVCQSGITIDTVSEKLHELERQKQLLQDRIDELSMDVNLQTSENIVCGLVESSKEFIKNKNLPKCKSIINSYIEKVVVYSDKVKVITKVNVPSKNKTLEPLIFEETLENIYNNYKDAV
ncbi:recombinase family protein [Anaerotignum sp. MB30-C6]|uniref:recombinase family protein n=1 Tax=Anaerotignum sp. MB30-C6 TaxID=3070814 RepID=UPI0027DB5CAC|nr:recombinase family protein [Anaerotignum sp. MB30-C6]WMI80552.1 recombinase family protein [Anaerotignum sp. MB30-C6]